MLRRFLSALTGTALFLTLAVSARAAGPIYPDLAGHWAQAEVEAAAQAGWVNGYPDGTFRPDGQVARAEFVKLLLGAVHLTPDSGTAAFLHQASQAAYKPVPLDDMGENWLTQAGWTQVAWEFGLIQAGDFPDRQFGPAVPLTRGEAAMLIARALGLVQPASQEEAEPLPFTDAGAIPQELRGYVREAVGAGAIQGLPDGSFDSGRTITRGEAVAMIRRALAWMEQGVDPAIRAYVREPDYYLAYGDGPLRSLEITLSAPAQVIDGAVYLPARDVIRSNTELYGDTMSGEVWEPDRQELVLNYILPYRFRAGDARYVGFGYAEINDNAHTFPTPARVLYGELMIPICGSKPASQTNLWAEAEWDAQQKTVVISLFQKYAPIS